MSKSQIRLQKIIAQAGITSRRKAEVLIEDGRISVNGQIAQIGDKANPFKDEICLDGEPINKPEEKITLRLHKPPGYITAITDDLGRPTVLDLITDIPQRIFPIGRLDFNSEGVLLLTNDGELAHSLTHPSQQLPRTYHVKVRGNPSSADFQKLTEGVMLDDGIARALHAERIRTTPAGHLWFEMVLTEGRNREVRRMCEAIGHLVNRLLRVKFGPIHVDDLRPGEYKILSKNDLKNLRTFMSPIQELPPEEY